MKTFENPKFRFLKKLFLDFPELRLGRAGKYADICILSGPSFFIPCNTESKTSAPRQTNCTKCFSNYWKLFSNTHESGWKNSEI